MGELGEARQNVVLERLLGRAGWTPENLGDHLNRLAASMDVKVYVNRRYPRRWVYAEKDRETPRIPREPVPALVCLLLHRQLGEPVTPEMLGWPATVRGLVYVSADDGLRQGWDGAGAIAALGEVVDADSMERRAVAHIGPALSRDRAFWLCKLATARVGSGSVEQGCATASEAVSALRKLESPRAQQHLADFRRTAEPYADSTAVREFDAKYRDLIRPL